MPHIFFSESKEDDADATESPSYFYTTPIDLFLQMVTSVKVRKTKVKKLNMKCRGR